MIDLHLFLGISMRSEPVDHLPNEALYGRIPQAHPHRARVPPPLT
jgi:hypothetical protein